MSSTGFYLDSSALLKLVTEEAETDALYAWWNSSNKEDFFVVSEIANTEVLGNATRISASAKKAAESVLSKISFIKLTTAILERATIHVATGLRTLDAIHVASAEGLSIENLTFVAYDRKLLSYAKNLGFKTISPS
jgi:predicted nucleic acid-binding protein